MLTVLLATAAHATLLADAADPALSTVRESAECVAVMQSWGDAVEGAELDGSAQAVFDVRVDAQAMLARLYADGTLDTRCTDAVRRADHVVRHALDDAAEGWLVAQGERFSEPLRDVQSGDVLVTRGTALSSAGIASLTEIDSAFSHNALVYVDDDGAAWTVEAYLERGAIVQPLAEFLAHDLGRIVVMRPADAELGAAAAEAAYRRVSKGRPIRYDDRFVQSGDALFCSEIAQWAYGELLDRPTDLPWDSSALPLDANPTLFDGMGITEAEISAPADLLFDPRFALVAEWREVDALDEMHRHDAVVRSLFRWMEEDGYVLDTGLSEEVLVRAGKAARGTPLLSLTVDDRLSRGLHRNFLVASLGLQRAAEALDAALVAKLDGSADLDALLEEVRAEDRAVWTERKRRAGFHRWVHPG